MKKVLVIIRREYLTRVRTKAFLFGTLATPLLLLGLALLPMFFAGRGGGQREVRVLDQSGDPALFEVIRNKVGRAGATSLPGEDGEGGDTRFVLSQEVVPPDKDIDDVRREHNPEIGNDSNKAYVVLRAGVLEEAEPEYYSKNISDPAIKDVERAISEAITQRRLVRAGFNPDLVKEYLKPVEVKEIKVSSEGESEESGFRVFQVAFIMLFFIYVTVLAYGISVMRGVIEEKQSRIIEVLVSSVKPTQVMFGKLIGIGLVGLTQYAIWIVLAMLISLLGAKIFASSEFAFPTLPISLLLYFVVYFVLGYFLYATFYACVGAMVSSEEEAQHVQFPVMMLLVLPMVLFGIILRDPSGAVAVTLSLIPFFSPTLMMMRIVLATPPWWQILLSMLLMAATIAGAVAVAARIYRVGILMYGKRPSLAELGRWIRYS